MHDEKRIEELKEYGQYHYNCNLNTDDAGDYNCDCGFIEVVKQYAEHCVQQERVRVYVELQKIADENDCKIKEGYIKSSFIYSFLNRLIKPNQ